METPEWLSRKLLVIITAVVIVSGIAVFVVMSEDELELKSVVGLDGVLETVTDIVPDIVPEAEPNDEIAVPDLENIPENVTDIENIAEPVVDMIPENITETVVGMIPENITEVSEIVQMPEILDIEIIEEPEPTIEIPEIPITIPIPPEEILEIPEQEIQDKVDRYNADPGTPVPAKNTISGTVTKIQSGNVIELSGVLVKLRGVDAHNEDDPDFNQWREALMRICPVGTLVIHNNPNGTPDSQGRISATVWCYGFPHAPPLASANEVMTEADYDIIGRGCSASSDTRLLGCTS